MKTNLLVDTSSIFHCLSQFLCIVLDVSPVLVHRQRFGAARDVLKPHRHEIPDVHTDVDAVARAFPVIVDMTEDLERVTACVVPGDHGVMAKRVCLLLGTVTDLSQMRDTGPR